MIITRKIQLNVDASGDEKKEVYERLYNILWGVRRCANIISSHLFTLDHEKDMIYLTDEFKAKLLDKSKDEEGILTTSYQNGMYRLVSQMYKGEIPSDILTNLVNNIMGHYKKEKQLVWQGKKSLRSYRESIPIPFSKNSIKFESHEKYFSVRLFKMPFKTYLGQDRSNNRVVIERVLSGEYALSGSSIQIKDNKIFLLLCVNIPTNENKLDPKKEVIATLSPIVPIHAVIGKKSMDIGSFEEYMHQKNAIYASRRRMQIGAKFTKGGKGRKKKLKVLEKDSYATKERNYVSTKLHTYAKALVQHAVRHGAGTIVLMPTQLNEEGKNELLLQDWGYYNLKTKIEYKAKIEGIKVKEVKE